MPDTEAGVAQLGDKGVRDAKPASRTRGPTWRVVKVVVLRQAAAALPGSPLECRFPGLITTAGPASY